MEVVLQLKLVSICSGFPPFGGGILRQAVLTVLVAAKAANKEELLEMITHGAQEIIQEAESNPNGGDGDNGMGPSSSFYF